MEKTNLKSLSEAELRHFISGKGLPDFRARQLIQWIYEKYALSLNDITVFSKDLRASLGESSYISNLEMLDRRTSQDGTEKFLFGLEDGLSIETVFIPDDGRRTLCISSQVGCAMGCRFCLTGRGGLRRNLKAFEIVDQVIAAGRLIIPEHITNIVMMGMGEPLQNLDEVAEALNRLNRLIGISKRKITVSTSGLVPGIEELPKVAPEINLAISLNATTDSVRSRLMPINRKYPIRELLGACRRYPLQKRRRITFEYVMLGGVNDTEADARRLVALLKGIPSKVNLIPFNEFESSELKRPSDRKVLAFQELLIKGGLTALVRKSKGRDIMAACGQLRGQHRKAGRNT